jgi:hypothetical protein
LCFSCARSHKQIPIANLFTDCADVRFFSRRPTFSAESVLGCFLVRHLIWVCQRFKMPEKGAAWQNLAQNGGMHIAPANFRTKFPEQEFLRTTQPLLLSFIRVFRLSDLFWVFQKIVKKLLNIIMQMQPRFFHFFLV